MLLKIIKILAKQYKLSGWYGVVLHIGRHLMVFSPFGRGTRLFLIVLSESRLAYKVEKTANDHIFRWATRDDLLKLMKIPSSEIKMRDLNSFDDGNRCLLQLDGEALVGYTWISLNPLVEILWGIHFNMPDDMVYNYNGYTAPAYRGTAYQALRHQKVLSLIQKEGKKRLFAYVDHMNYHSLSGTRKSGYKIVGTIKGFQTPKRLRFSIKVSQDCWAKLVRMGPHQFI